ncbi:MAG: glycosyl hydrolase [Ignavibacteriales bacterium]|nr:glycosyl hydrolase [Ignavibacteriales bacterium]
MKKYLATILLVLSLCSVSVMAEKADTTKKDPLNTSKFGGLKFRSIGPAFTSGRIADFAVNPKNHSEYYVASASGHVWKTINAGTTFEPVFDNCNSYSIGCVVIDPNNSNVVWVGTGENNHQRALGYGDGVYKSIDGGKSFKNMGLKDSRQIGGIVIDPRNSNVVYVAAEGSVWGPGGDRGLFKSVDGGKTWKKALNISENTGVNNIVFDPRDPNVLYATSEQRRRHVYTKINGGPESAVYKSIDAGETWEKIMSGLPTVDIGGTGIAVSPVNPDYVYIIVEAAEGKSGFFRSTNRGASWDKMSDHVAQGQYYNEIYCDPKDVEKVYSVETITNVTEDGGKTWKSLGNNSRHVDDHALWIDPDDTKHFLIGGDGGVYESFDGGKNYVFKSNLPVTQLYRVNVDNSEPFYYVYGGTQDNNSFGGPSRTINADGIVNGDWFVTNGGDGFWTAIDPTNPNIVYAEAQYGNMVRYDKKSGEVIDIRPEPRKGELTYKWNWDTPLIISAHSPSRLYCAANKIFRSDDHGDTWEVISDDLTRQLDRNTWQVMGKYWSVDAVSKDVSTSLFGEIVSLVESPVKENLIYAGTDDGLIQVSEDAKTWTKTEKFPGVPEYTYVSDILADKFNENIVYAAFNNHLRDDFKPYLLKSNDKGKSWESIAGNLPANGMVHSIEQDFINPNLLFVGTEFGFYFSFDGGEKWIQLKSGLPAIPVRDIAIQKRENDIVIATFGRGFYILDNYSPLREVTKELFEKDAYLFPIKDALMYIPKWERYGQGSTYYKAPNPEFGATFSYYFKEVPKTLKQIRKEKEKDLFKDGKPIPQPTYAELQTEEKEIAPYFIFTIMDETGNVVRKINSEAKDGINRIVWDLKYESAQPINLKDDKFDPVAKGNSGLLAMPGNYKVAMALVTREGIKELIAPTTFNTTVLNNTTLPAANRAEVVTFQKKAMELGSIIIGTQKYTEELVKRVEFIKQALNNTPSVKPDLLQRAEQISKDLDDVLFAYNGQPSKASAEEVPPQAVPLNNRLGTMIYTQWVSTSNVTLNQKRSYEILQQEFPPILEKVKKIESEGIKPLEAELDKAGAPWTPGRLPSLR